MSRILFVYPNKEAYPIIPIGISILSSVVKREGHEVGLFDTTFMFGKRFDLDARTKSKTVEEVSVDKCWGLGNEGNVDSNFKEKIRIFRPDIIAFSIVECNYSFAKKLFSIAKKESDAYIVVGGSFPIIAPEFFLDDENIDFICVGEGEYALVELIKNIKEGRIDDKLPNIISRHSKTVGSFYPYYNWIPATFQNFGLFDERHLLKPFMGKIHRTGFFEMSRGCPYKCAFCANEVLQKVYRGIKGYHRERPMEQIIKEIEYMADKYNLNLIFFSDETFMLMSAKRFQKFCVEYKRRIDLPFFIQTRADTLLNENRVRMLKKTNCISIGVGLETGSYRLRKEVLNKSIPDDIYIEAFRVCHKFNIRTTVGVMLGLPTEVEEDMQASIDFCKKLKPGSINISIFSPYHGTSLRKLCIDKHYIEDVYDDTMSISRPSILNMPQLSKETIDEYFYKFVDEVYNN